MEMTIWNIVLTAVIAALGYAYREKSEEMKRIEILLNKTREEVAKEYAQGRIVSCLEGGYNLSALGRSVVAHVKTLADI
mgnify:CR=1 FL=1